MVKTKQTKRKEPTEEAIAEALRLRRQRAMIPHNRDRVKNKKDKKKNKEKSRTKSGSRRSSRQPTPTPDDHPAVASSEDEGLGESMAQTPSAGRQMPAGKRMPSSSPPRPSTGGKQ
jgi:hypothetical protein